MRILLIGDGIALTSGFAAVLRHFATAAIGAGHDVGQITSLDEPPYCDTRPYYDLGVIPFLPAGDAVGFTVLPDVLTRFQPDRLVFNCDPGMLRGWLLRLQALGATVPALSYVPVEGKPVSRLFCEAFAARGTSTMLYARCAADEVERTCGVRYPWVYHGVDRDVFQPLPADERERLRAQLGWTDSFVVMYVGRNCARKQQDVLIEAMAQIKRTVPEALLYLHTKPFDGYWGQGWDLEWLCEQRGVSDWVEFPLPRPEALRGEPTIGLAKKLGCADLYVHAAAVEGLGLPILEAMASALPVIIPQDDWVMEEIGGAAPLITVDPFRRAPWFTGAELALTLPDQWARAIHWAYSNPEQRAAASVRSLERAQAFDWDVQNARLLAALATAGEREPAEASA